MTASPTIANPLPGHHPSHLAEFIARLDRVEKYLRSSKLAFHGGALELNPAPFAHAEQALPAHSPLAYLLLFMRETCWSEADLAGRRIMVSALRSWCRGQMDLA